MRPNSSATTDEAVRDGKHRASIKKQLDQQRELLARAAAMQQTMKATQENMAQAAKENTASQSVSEVATEAPEEIQRLVTESASRERVLQDQLLDARAVSHRRINPPRGGF